MSKILAQGMITLTQLYEGAQVILTPSAVLIPCDSKEAPKPNAYVNAFTNVRAFLGTMDITSKMTLGTLEYSDSTVKASKTGTKVSITAITTRTGYVDIPVSVTIDGETIDLGKHRFSFVKQIDGQTGQTGAQGAPGFSYTLNIKGGTRGVAYAANGTNPEPKTSSQFSVELLKNGVKIANPASISWTCGGNLSGSSSAATFTPTIKSTYNSESSYVKVSVKEFAASLAVEETIPIVCTKHADGLDWINEWNNKYVQVGTEKIITPKIFAGTKNNANELTGVAIGRDVLGGNANKVIGIVGYKKNTPVFSLDQDANFFVSSSGNAGDIKNGTNNAKGIYFDGNNLYVSGKVKISGGSTIGESNTSVEEVINNSNLGAQANNKIDNLSIGGRNLALKTSNNYSTAYSNFNGSTNICPSLAKVLTDGLKVGDTVTVRLLYKYTNIVAAAGQTAKCWIQGSGDVTAWNSGAFHSSPQKAISGSGEHEFKYSFTITENHVKNSFWSTNIRHDYVQSGSVQWKLLKIEKGNKATDWSPAPEDLENAYTIILTNEAQVIPTDSSRKPTSSATYSTDIQVYKGSTQRTDYTIGTINSANGITVSKTSSRVNFAVSTGTALTADGGYFSIPITIDGKTFNKTFSWSCSKQGIKGDTGGDGQDAQYVILNGDQVFKYSNNFAGAPTPENIKIQATAYGISNPRYTWEFKRSGETTWNTITSATNNNQNYYTLPHDNSTIFNSSSVKSVTIRCTVNGHSDEITIVKVSDGAKGDTGVAGNGINTITEYYAVSSSNTTVPTSWSTTVPSMTSTNKYLWNYEVIKYTNNTTKETAKRVIGVYGDKGNTGATGATGNGISKIVNYYLATSSSSGVTTSTSGWTTSVQAVSASKKYLWNYEVITYTNNSTTTSTPCIIGTYGDKGDAGATGQNADSVGVISKNYDIVAGNGHSELYIRGKKVANSSVTGHTVFKINKTTLAVEQTTKYATYGNESACTEMANYLNGLSDCIVAIISSDACRVTDALRTAISKIGGSKTGTWGGSRYSHYVIGMPGLTSGQGYEEYKTGASATLSCTVPVSLGVGILTNGAQGIQGSAGKDAYTVILTNESHTFPAENNGSIASDITVTTDVLSYKGASSITPTIGTLPTVNGLTLSKTNNRVTIVAKSGTALANSGSFNIPITVDGKSFTKTFSWAKSRKGNTGATGATGAGAKTADIIASSQVFKSTDGGKTFLPDTITLTPTLQNVTFSKWQYSIDGGRSWSNVSSGSNGLTVSGNNLQISKSSNLFTSTNTTAVFKVITNDSAIYDTMTVVKLYDVTELEVGGRNYLQNSNFANGLSNWTVHDMSNSTGTNKSVSTVKGGSWADPNVNTLQIRGTNVTGRYGVISSDITLVANTTYTISGYCAGHRVRKIQVNVRDIQNSSANIHTVEYNPVSGGNSLSKYYKFETTFTTTSNTLFALNLYAVDLADNGYAWFANVKLEKGNKASDWIPAPEDVDKNINDVKNSLNSFQTTVNTTFKDGIIEQAEAKAIAQHLKTLDAEKADIDKEYAAIYSNTYLAGTAKTNLSSAKSSYDSAHTNLKSTINTAIADGKVTTSESSSVTNTFNTYNTQLGIYKQRVQEALDNISSGKVDNIQIGGRNIATHTNQGTTGWVWGLQTGGKTISEVTENGIKCCKMVRDNVASTGWSYIGYSRIGRDKYLPNKQYTISFEVKSSVVTKFTCSLMEGNATNGLTTNNATAQVPKANTWTKLSFTLTTKDTLPTSTTQCVYLSGMSSDPGVTYIFRNLMIEEGTKASSWAPAPEDIDNNITDVKNSLSGFQNTVNTTFKDGIIEQAEAKAIARHIQILDTEKADVDKEYSIVYNNSALSGTAKTNLASAKTEFDNAHTSLKSTINTAIADGRVTSSEKTSVDSTFSTYNSRLGIYRQRVQEALDAISSAKVDNIQIGGRNLFLKSDIDKYGMGLWINNGGTGSVEGTYIDGTRAIKVVGDTGIMYNSWIKLKRNTTYVYSMMMKASPNTLNILGNRPLHMWLNTTESSNHLEIIQSTSGTVPADTWTKAYVVFKTPNTQDLYYMRPFIYGIGNNNTVYISKVKIEEGTKPTEWTPAPEDIDAEITAVNNKAQDSINKLTELASDSKLTASEKLVVKREWDAIVGEKTKITSEADKFGVSKTDYESKYNTLNSYITPLLSNLTTTSDINGSTFRSNFTNYYNSRQDLLNAITTKVKTLADNAQSTANTANNTANTVNTTVNNNKNNWSNAYERVKQWASGAITGSTTINGGMIEANTIVAEKIAIGDFTNYAQLNETTASKLGFIKESNEAGGAWLRKNGMARDIFISDTHTCNGGESFRIKFDISTTIKGNSSNGGADSTYRGTAIGLYCYNGTGASVGIVYSTRYSNTTVNGSSSYVTIPASARKFRVFIQTESYGNFSGDLKVRNVQVTKMASGELIVDGSIKTSMIHSDGLNASVIKAGTISADRLDANTIVSKVNGGTTEINGNRIQTGTLSADKLKIQSRDSFSVNPNFANWTSTYPYGTSSWVDGGISKVTVDNRYVAQFNVSNASSQQGMRLNGDFFNRGLNLDGMQYIGLEVKYRLTSGTNPAGACMLLDIFYTDGSYDRLNLSLKSINPTVTTNTWYTAKRVFKVSNIQKTFKSVSGYLLANWSSETLTAKIIQFASANAYACTEQDYLTQTWTSGTEINGASIKTGTLSADKITTGTLDANKVNVTNIKAGNIVSGTIDASKISVTNLNASNITSGTLRGRTIEGGTISNGSTVIDSNGLTVNNGAIKIKNKAGNTVLSGDSNGNLTLNGTIKSEASNGQYVAVNSGGITFKDSQKSEEVLRISTSFSNNNRDINGVTFAMPQYSDRISFRHIAKPSLENGWNGSETTYTFMEMWSTDYNHSNGKNYKGINVFAPMYLSQKIRFRNGGDQYLHEVTPNITWNNMEKLLGVYGDNGTIIGYKSADSLMTRIVVTEQNHPGTGDSIRSWGNWNCTGATVHNATFNGRHVNSYANTETRTVCNTAAVMAEGNQVRVNFENVQIKDGKAILSIPKRYRGINEGYTIASIVKKGRGDVWVSEEEEERFIIEAENDIKINIEVIIKLTEAVVARTLKHEDSICYEVPNEQPEGDCC